MKVVGERLTHCAVNVMMEYHKRAAARNRGSEPYDARRVIV